MMKRYYAILIKQFSILMLILIFSISCNKTDNSTTPSDVVPTINTLPISGITTTSAICGGTITSNGGDSITVRGICWSTAQLPTIADNKLLNSTLTGTATGTITGLISNTTYYVRAFATNSVGTGYGSTISFTTMQVMATHIPMLTTVIGSGITRIGAKSGGMISSDGGAVITAKGICYDTIPAPKLNSNSISNSATYDGSGPSNFTSVMSKLISNTTYYVRAYATNSNGTAYGNEVIIKTLPDLVLNVETVDISGGAFTMGSPTNEINHEIDESQFQVTLDDFKMSKFEITNAQFAIFLNNRYIGSNGIDSKGPYPSEILILPTKGSIYNWGLNFTSGEWVPVVGYENHPASQISWYGASAFAIHIGGRLPTEAEWEYACRAGTATEFNTGGCLNETQANYNWAMPYSTCTNNITSSSKTAQRVGSYPPNKWGLFDMHGNSFEWCNDWYGSYPTSPQTNPSGPNNGKEKVVRGGSWGDSGWFLRSANRGSNIPILKAINGCFRIVIPK